jgi:septal ring factor EnvC (AmiA/AmiB activator)
MNIFTIRNFNKITRKLNKQVKGLESDIKRVDADIIKQEGIIAKADAIKQNLSVSKVAVANLRDQLKAITA